MHWQEYVERYGMESDCNIIEDAHLGIINGHITTNTWHSNVLSLRGLSAPPFAGSNYVWDGWI